MDVTGKTFCANLPEMLSKLADCEFVALDFELSGVAEYAKDRGQVSLQEHYSDIKRAAEEYTIVQVGLTFVHEENGTDSYVAYPYNMYLNPLVGGNLEVPRSFTLQSKAVTFLLDNGFNFQSLLEKGVPCLSRRETEIAKFNEMEKLNKGSIRDVILNDSDHELRKFVANTRLQIKAWLEDNKHSPELIVSHDEYLITRMPGAGLDRLEKRLVHQLVRSEFSDLTSTAIGGAVSISKFSCTAESARRKQLKASTEERIQRQCGIRWLIEALCGGELEKMDIISCKRWGTDHPILIDEAKEKKDFSNLCRKIKRNQPVIVGHNLFADLVYFYRTFIGHLPAKIEDFVLIIHQLFPRIIDTKFLGSQLYEKRGGSSLADLDRELSNVSHPKLVINDHRFQKYEQRSSFHEAGFDSFATARALIKLAPKIYVEALQAGLLPESILYFHGFEGAPSHHSKANDVANPVHQASLLSIASPSPLPNAPTFLLRLPMRAGEVSSGSGGSKHSPDASQAHSGSTTKRSFGPSPPPGWLRPSLARAKHGNTEPPPSGEDDSIIYKLPPWESLVFWNACGNLLLVNGTISGVLRLGNFYVSKRFA